MSEVNDTTINSPLTEEISIHEHELSQTEDDLTSRSSTSTNVTRKTRRSPIRDLLDETPNGLACKFCRTTFGPKTGTSTITRHFQSKHSNEFNQFKQSTLPFRRTDPYGKHDKAKVTVLNDALLKWVICDQQPFNLMENQHFRELILELDNRYQLPSRQTISTQIVSIFTEKQTAVREMLQKMNQKVSLTVDMWSSCTNQAYLAVTIHWIDEDWRLRHFLLDLLPFKETHTGIHIADQLLQLVEDMDIGTKILSLTTDNASSMITCGRTFIQYLQDNYQNSEVEHRRCAAHILNLSVEQGKKCVDDIVVKARQFASTIRRSQKYLEELKRIFEMKSQPFLIPDIDVPTRWNSMYAMLLKLKRIRSLTDILVTSNPTLNEIYPSENEWESLEVIVMEISTIDVLTISPN